MTVENLTRAQVVQKISEIRNQRTEIRKQERDIVGQTKIIAPLISDKADLRSSLAKILPKHLVPTNVGQYKQILTPMWYETTHDFGMNPTYGPLFRDTNTFQISQEAGFLLTSISREWNDRSYAGFGAPLKITIRDNQSTRQFNNVGIPLQMIGYKGLPSELDTPLLFVPNASVSVIVESWLAADFATIGNGYHQFCFHGYRVNMSDAKLLAETMYL